MRVAIIEPHAEGHHGAYLRWLVQGVRARGWACTVVTTQPVVDHPMFASLLGTVDLQLIPELAVPDPSTGGVVAILRRELRYWRAIRRAVAREQAQHRVNWIVLSYLDYCFHVSAVLGPPFAGLPGCAISMRLSCLVDGTPRRLQAPLKWRLVQWMLGGAGLARLWVINPSVQALPTAWLPTGSRAKLRYLADPADEFVAQDRDAARVSIGLGADSIAVLVFGSIDERKGLEYLLDSLHSHIDLRDFVAVVAGKCAAATQALLARPKYSALRTQGRVIVLDEFHSDAAQARLFSAADIAWVGYVGHQFMSGVLVLAGKAGLPVIACDEGEIGWLVRERELGLIVDVRQSEQLHRALLELQDPETRRGFHAQARRGFVQHTPRDFCASLLADANPGSPA